MYSARQILNTTFAAAALALTALVLVPAAALAAAQEEPTTEAATSIAATTATLNGVLSPKSLPEFGDTYEFRYKASSTVSKTECESPEALKAPEPAALANGGEAEHVEIGVGSLTQGTEYVACLVATSPESESTFGPAVAFKTTVPPEEPESQPATEVKGTTVTLHGVLNPNGKGEAGTYEFLYSPSASECQAEGEQATPPVAALGNEGEAVSAEVTGLVGGTSYTFCLRATNGASESAVSGGQSFATLAEKPVVATESVANVTPFAATLQAEVNPENDTATSCAFEYGKVVTDNKVPCEQIELTGSSQQFVSRTLAGLEPATVYHYRVVVTNSTGTTKGPEEEFTTAAAEAPAIVSEAVSAITPFQARLEGVLNPNFQPTRCHFLYGLTTASETEVPCEPEFLEGFGEQGVGSTITGLLPETTYHYMIAAKNPAGKTEGKEEEFTTLPLEAPAVASESVPFISSTDAQLEARINPKAQETTFAFEYSTSESLVAERKATEVKGETTLPAVFEEVGAGPVDLGGALKPGTTYYYRVIATNGTGKTLGTIETFTTSAPEPPIVGSESASGVTESSVTFEASINPNGTETTYEFEYATDEGFTENAATVPLVPLALPSSFPEELPTEPVVATGLKGETVYFYRVVATSEIMGTTDGPTQQFKTLGKPGVTTGAAEKLTSSTATVSGTVNPGGAQTTYKFVYVTEAHYNEAAGCSGIACRYAQGWSTTNRSVFATGYSPEVVGSVTLEELVPGETYDYALVATNSTGTTVGPNQTFATSSAPPPEKPAEKGGPTPETPPVLSVPLTPPLVGSTSIAVLDAKEAKENKANEHLKPTKAQLLTKALKACRKKHGSKRSSCERAARKRYGASKHGKKGG
jgi:hypothetical protein